MEMGKEQEENSCYYVLCGADGFEKELREALKSYGLLESKACLTKVPFKTELGKTMFSHFVSNPEILKAHEEFTDKNENDI